MGEAAQGKPQDLEPDVVIADGMLPMGMPQDQGMDVRLLLLKRSAA